MTNKQKPMITAAELTAKLQADPEDPTWLFGKGFASIQLKKYDDAIAALKQPPGAAAAFPVLR